MKSLFSLLVGLTLLSVGSVSASDLVIDGENVTGVETFGPATTVTVRNTTVEPTGDLTIKANSQIRLGAGFRVKVGGLLKIRTVVNFAPVVQPETYETNEDVPLNVAAPGVLANDFDPEGAALSAVLEQDAQNGLVLAADGSFQYTPDADFNGTDSFTYRASDGTDESVPTTVTINVISVNDAPTVETAASASPPTAGGIALTALSVLGKDDGGEENLVYSWSATGPSVEAYSINDSNDAKSTIASIIKAGAYTFTVTITDQGNPDPVLSTSSSVLVSVQSTLSEVVVSPTVASTELQGPQAFSAIAKDQFGHPFGTQPTFIWSVSGGGSISGSGLFTAGSTNGDAGQYTVTATEQGGAGFQGTASITVVNAVPEISTIASALPEIVIGTSTQLSVLGADDGGESNLTYTWSKVSGPADSVSFSSNGLNLSKNTTVTFSKKGSFVFEVLVSDGVNEVSDQVSVSVLQAVASIVVTPDRFGLNPGETHLFSAAGIDQFENPFEPQEGYSWSVTGDCTITNTGSLTAGASNGTCTISVTSAGLGTGVGSALVKVGTNALPTIKIAATVSESPVLSTEVLLSVLGADADDGESVLTYTWAVTSGQSVSFSVNDGNAAKQTTATFGAAGDYEFQVTVTDPWGAKVTSIEKVNVSQVPITITVQPSGADVASKGNQQFSATAIDQFNDPMVLPHVAWIVSGGGAIDSNGLFTAGESSAADLTVHAVVGNVSGLQLFSVTNAAPLIIDISAIIDETDKKTALLSVSATDGGDEANLLYYWEVMGEPAGLVVFSKNIANVAAITTAKFTRSGTYTFKVTVTDIGGEKVEDSVELIVASDLLELRAEPEGAVVAVSETRLFSAVGTDQFGQDFEPADVVWTVNGGGVIDDSGNFSAGAEAGGPYTVTATIGQMVASAQFEVNQPPVIAFTSLNNGQIFSGQDSISLEVNATDSDQISKIEFFQGGVKIGEAIPPNDDLVLENLPAGTYLFSAKATDGVGLTSETQVVTIIVNAPPLVRIISPLQNKRIDAPATISVVVDAIDADGTISNVVIRKRKLGIPVWQTLATLTTQPFAFEWTNVLAGFQELQAVATDDRGLISYSEIVQIQGERFWVLDLGTLKLDNTGSSRVNAMNESGQLVGWTSSDDGNQNRAAIWENGTWVMLPSSNPFKEVAVALDINDAGVVVGYHNVSTWDTAACKWSGGGASQGVYYSMLENATGIDAVGNIVAGNMLKLFSGGAPTTLSSMLRANTIYSSTLIAGKSNGATGSKAVLYNNGSYIYLTSGEGEALKMPFDNKIVGKAKNSDGNYHAHYWLKDEQGNWSSLDVDTMNNSFSEARDVNSSGQIVGYYNINGAKRAFLYENSSQTDLNYLIHGMPPTFGLQNANAIDNVGRIAVNTGTGGPGNGGRAYLLAENTDINVVLKSPTVGSTYFVGDDVEFIAEASTAVSNIAKVEFWSSSLIGESQSTTSPYSLTTQFSNSGDLKVQAKVTDDQGVVRYSLPVLVTISADQTPPIITPPANMVVEADGPAGKSNVVFTASATDNRTSNPVITSSPASGSTFPKGATNVTIFAQDDALNQSQESFTVTVVDTTPPVVTAPVVQAVDATQAGGAFVNFVASATDLVDGNISSSNFTFSHASGSLFPHGLTTVLIKAYDWSGNYGYTTLAIQVNGTETYPVPGEPPPETDLPPTLVLTAPIHGQVVKSKIVNVAGTVTNDDGVNRVTVLIAGGIEDLTISPDALGKFSVPLLLADGKHEIIVTAIEAGQNPVVSFPLSVWVDTLAPANFTVLGSNVFNDHYESRPAVWNQATTNKLNHFTSPSWFSGSVSDPVGYGGAAPTGVAVMEFGLSPLSLHPGILVAPSESYLSFSWLAPVTFEETPSVFKSAGTRHFGTEGVPSFGAYDAAGNNTIGSAQQQIFWTPVILEPGDNGKIAIQKGDEILVNMRPGDSSWVEEEAGGAALGSLTSAYSIVRKANGTFYSSKDKLSTFIQNGTPQYDVLRLTYHQPGADQALELDLFAGDGRAVQSGSTAQVADATAAVSVFDVGMRVVKPDGLELSEDDKATPGLVISMDGGDDDGDGLPNTSDSNGLNSSSPVLAKLIVRKPNAGNDALPATGILSLLVYAPVAENGFGDVAIWYDPDSTSEPAPGTSLQRYNGQPIDINSIDALTGKTFYLQGSGVSSFSREIVTQSGTFKVQGADVAVVLEYDPEPNPDPAQKIYAWKKICRDAVWVTVTPSDLGLVTDANHDGRINPDDVDAAKTLHGVVMAAGFGLSNHPKLEDRIEVKIYLDPSKGSAFLSLDNPYVKVFSQKTGGTALDPNSLTFTSVTSVYLEFTADEEVSLTLKRQASNGVSAMESILKISRLANGLGVDNLAPVVSTAQGHALVNLTRGNLFFAISAKSYATPQITVLSPNVSLAYNHLDGIATGMGRGFRTNYDVRVFDGSVDSEYDGTVVMDERRQNDALHLIDEAGRRFVFHFNETTLRFEADNNSGLLASFVDPDRANFDSTGDLGFYYKLTRHDNRFYFFDKQGLLIRIRDLRGRELFIDREGIKALSVRDVEDAANARVESLVRDGFEGLGAEAAGPESVEYLSGGQPGVWHFEYGMHGGIPCLEKISSIGNFSHDATGKVTWELIYNDTSAKITGINLPVEGLNRTIAYTPQDTSKAGATSVIVSEPYGGTTSYNTILPTLDSWLSMTNAASITSVRVLDQNDRQFDSLTVGSYEETYTYDSLGNVATHGVTGGVITTYAFTDIGIEGANFPLTVMLPEPGGTTTYEYHQGVDAEKGGYTINSLLWGLTYEITDPCDATTQFAYDVAGSLDSYTDRRNKQWSIVQKNSYGQALLVSSPVGRFSETTYRSDTGQVETSTDMFNLTTTYYFDDRDRAVGASIPGGGSTSTLLDPLGRVIRSTDLNSRVRTVVYDALGRLKSSAIPGIDAATMDYSARTDGVDGWQVSANRGTRHLYTVKQDAIGRRESVTVDRILNPETAPETSTPCTTTYVYEAGEVWLDTVTNAVNSVTTYAFDSAGRLDDIVPPGGGMYDSNYNTAGWSSDQSDPDGVGTSNLYFACGDILSVTNGKGGIVTYTYDDERNLETVRRNDGSRGVSYTYDDDGMQETFTSGLQFIQRFSIEITGDVACPGKLTSELLNPDQTSTGRFSTRILDARGLVKRIETHLGGVTMVKRSDGTTLQVKPDRRGASGVTLDGLDRATASYSPTGGSSRQFDANTGDLTETTNALGLTAQVDLDDLGDINFTTDDRTPAGMKNTQVLERDRIGRTRRFKDADNREWIQNFDDDLRTKTLTSPDQLATEWQYSEGGRLQTITMSGGGRSITRRFDYDELGLVNKIIEPSNRVTHIEYDKFGRRTSTRMGSSSTTYILDPDTKQVTEVVESGAKRTIMFRDGQGRVEYVEQGGERTDYVYNDDPISGFGRLTDVIHPDNKRSSYVYWTGSQDVKIVTDRAGRQTRLYYDGAGRVVTKKFLDTGDVVQYAYNPAGQVLTQSFNGKLVTKEYDGRGRLESIEQGANGPVVSFEYTNGNRLKKKSYGGQELEYVYLPNGRLDKVIETLNGTREISFGYDGLGRMNSQSLPNNLTRTFTFDDSGRKASMTQTLGGSVENFSYAYDGQGRLKQLGGPAWKQHFDYDASGRLARETRTGLNSYRHTYGYDNRDNRTSMTSLVGGNFQIINEDFNGADQDPLPGVIASQPTPVGTWTLQSQKLAASNVDTAYAKLDLGSGVTPFSFLVQGDATNLTNVGDEQLAGLVFGKTNDGQADDGHYVLGVTTRIVDVDGQATTSYALELKWIPANGDPAIVESSEPIADYQGEEARLNVSLVSTSNSLSAELFSVPVDLNEDPQLLAEVNLNPQEGVVGEQGFEVRALPQGKQAIASFDDFAYFTSSGSTSESRVYAYNGMNQLQTITGTESTSYIYDDAGNMSDRTKNGVLTQYGFDRLNRLTSVKEQNGLFSTYSYYGPTWMRASSTVTDEFPVTTNFVYDGFACIERTVSGGASVNYFVAGKRPLWESQSGSVGVFAEDGLGNISGAFSGSNYSNKFSYDAFGNLKSTDGNGNPVPNTSGPRYRGQLQDSETKQVYLRNRFYQPSTGRFSSMDPKGNVDGPNMYNYVHSDPVNNWDPMGLWTVKGLRRAFWDMYGREGRNLLRFAKNAGYKIRREDPGWTQDHDIDDVRKIIQIPNGWYTTRNSYFGGYDDSNEEAAEQLFENLTQNFDTASGRILAKTVDLMHLNERMYQGVGAQRSTSAGDRAHAEARRIGSHGQNYAKDAAVEYTATFVGGVAIGGLIKSLKPISRFRSYRKFRVEVRKLKRKLGRNGGDLSGFEICFAAGTKVKTENGWKNIEKIQPGDKVFSKSSKTGEFGLKTVTRIFVTAPNKWVKLKFRCVKALELKSDRSDASRKRGTYELVGTPNHPFWSDTRKAWVQMGDLLVNERLLLDDGTFGEVVGLKFEKAEVGTRFKAYNFEVEKWHTYFVAPNSESRNSPSVWVHNTGRLCAKGKARVREYIADGYHWRDAISIVRGKPIQAFSVRPYIGSGFSRSFPGHEVLNNAWFEIKGITKRGIGWQSRKNPAIAISRRIHTSDIQKAQRRLGVWFRKDLEKLDRVTVIGKNLEALRSVGVPEEAVQRLRRAVITHARKLR